MAGTGFAMNYLEARFLEVINLCKSEKSILETSRNKLIISILESQLNKLINSNDITNLVYKVVSIFTESEKIPPKDLEIKINQIKQCIGMISSLDIDVKNYILEQLWRGKFNVWCLLYCKITLKDIKFITHNRIITTNRSQAWNYYNIVQFVDELFIRVIY